MEGIIDNISEKIADIILNEAVDNNFGKTKDDMSIVVCKLIRKN